MNIYSDGELKKMKVCVTATAGDLNAQVDPRFGIEMYKTGKLSETDAATVSAHTGMGGGSSMGGGQGGGIGISKGLDKQQPTTSQAPPRIKKGVIL